MEPNARDAIASKIGTRTNRIEGRADAGHARASPRVKYPKLAIRTRRKRRALMLSSVDISDWGQ